MYEHVDEALLTVQDVDFLDDDPTPTLPTSSRKLLAPFKEGCGREGKKAGLFDALGDDGGDEWLQLSSKSSK